VSEDSDMHLGSTSRRRRLIGMLAILAVTGCTQVIEPPKDAYTGYATQEKIKLRVGLNLTDEFRQAKWEDKGMLIPIGPALARDSEILVRQVFTDVTDVQNTAQPGSAGMDAVLTPRVAYVNRTLGATSFGDSVVTVKVEWDLEGRNGQTIWADTVTGESRGSTGWSRPEGVLKKAYEELLSKSQEAMTKSGAIRHYAASQ
jgi:hypothetical protein